MHVHDPVRRVAWSRVQPCPLPYPKISCTYNDVRVPQRSVGKLVMADLTPPAGEAEGVEGDQTVEIELEPGLASEEAQDGGKLKHTPAKTGIRATS